MSMQKQKFVNKTTLGEQRREYVVLGNEIEEELEKVEGFRSYIGPIPVEVDKAERVKIKARFSNDFFQPREFADI